LRGRRLEYELCKLGRTHSWSVIRASGSHGFADIVWFREKYKLPGTALEGLELLRMNGWLPEPDSRIIPDPFQYSFYRFLRGLSKHWIFVRVVDDGMSHVILIQAKTRLGKKGKRT
jgi:hypothetical protein